MQRDADLPRRLYDYQHRIRERHRVPLVTLVLLGDPSCNWRPNTYRVEFAGCRLEFRDLAQQIVNLHLRSRQTYGSPRIVAALRTHGRTHGRRHGRTHGRRLGRRHGRRHGHHRVARLMRLQGLRGRQPSRYRPQTTDSRHPRPVAIAPEEASGFSVFLSGFFGKATAVGQDHRTHSTR